MTEVEGRWVAVCPTCDDPVHLDHEEMACWVDGCAEPVENFTEAFPAPPEVVRDQEQIPRGVDSHQHGLVMCDHHHVAARILAYTRSEPPYVDIGLYQECTYYARALAAETFDIPSSEKVTAPQNAEDES